MTDRTGLRVSFAVALVVLAGVGAVVTPVAADAGADDGPAGATAQTDDCTFPVTMTDATGTAVTVASEPERVVTLGPSAAQTMWEIGAEEKVVGLSKYASYLEGADSRTNVSGAGRSFVVAEKVVALEPDLVLAPNIIGNETVEKLRSAGLTVYRFEAAASMDDIRQKTERIGRLTGACEGAAERVRAMNATLERVRRAVEGRDRPRVLYYMSGGYTAGDGTFIDTIITTAGGTNLAAAAGIDGYGQISPEVVVKRNPQWILRGGDYVTVPKTAAFNGTTAVQKGQVRTLNANYVSQPAPRTVLVVERLAKTFHPAAFAEAPTSTTQPTTETTDSATTETTTPPPTSTTATTTPGVGVGGALLALVLAGFWAVRR
ncbi:MAG: PGF-CTERM-anchored ABC transporter substrate-binding protein [Halanaeroarchaeum sp.]